MVPVEVAIERLRNPKPGSKIWEAKEYGVDLTLLMSSLSKTADERLRDLERAANDLEEFRDAFREPRRARR